MSVDDWCGAAGRIGSFFGYTLAQDMRALMLVEDGELLDELLTYRVAHSVVQAWGDALGTGAWYYVGVVSAAAVIGPQVHPGAYHEIHEVKVK